MDAAERHQQKAQHPRDVYREHRAPAKRGEFREAERARIAMAGDLFDAEIALAHDQLPNLEGEEQWGEKDQHDHENETLIGKHSDAKAERFAVRPSGVAGGRELNRISASQLSLCTQPTTEGDVMNSMSMILNYLLTSIVAGVLGGVAMLFVMWLMTRNGLAKGNMVVALGGLVTRSRERALRVGLM